MSFGPHVLSLDADHAVDSISRWIKEQAIHTLHRRGIVLGLSGGIDSAVCAALCVKSLGRENVLALLMPEVASNSDSLRLGMLVVERLGVPYIVEEISAMLEAAGCYQRQEEAIREVLPEYENEWKFKLTLPSVVARSRLAITSIVVEKSDGECIRRRMSASAYRKLVAATNFKQRVRKMIEYYHADRLHYAVCGTPNRLEYDQGFFVKNGDGSADLKPIAHLYKTQVFHIARFLGIPQEIMQRVPTTDTFSLPQTQEEFYFGLPYDKMDLCIYAVNNGIPPSEVAPSLGHTVEQVQLMFSDILSKRRATRNLHLKSLVLGRILDSD